MKVRRIIVLLAALLIIGYDVGQRVQASTIEAGSKEDPIVTVGYVKKYLDDTVKPLANKLASNKTRLGNISTKVQSIHNRVNLQLVFIIGKKTATLGTTKIEMETSPVIHKNRTILPLRFIGQALGAQMLWDNKTKKITYTKGSTTIVLRLNSNKATVNGKTITLDASPIISNGRTLVPVRFVSENLNAQVDYISKTKTIIIKGK